MQLDKTFIAIRERDFFDILDLSWQIITAFFAPLCIALLIGILPVAFACNRLAKDFAEIENESDWRMAYSAELGYMALFAAPLAGAPATLVLGQALFLGRPDARRVAHDLCGSLGQLLVFQFLLRTILFLPLVTFFIPGMFLPYLSEIVLLERNPFFAGSTGRITTWRRARALHRGSVGDLMVRFTTSAMLAGVLGALTFAALCASRQWITGGVNLDRATYMLYWQFSVWAVVAYFTVVRFLSYVDLRIRREGWEVELKLRAEAARMQQELV